MKARAATHAAGPGEVAYIYLAQIVAVSQMANNKAAAIAGSTRKPISLDAAFGQALSLQPVLAKRHPALWDRLTRLLLPLTDDGAIPDDARMNLVDRHAEALERALNYTEEMMAGAVTPEERQTAAEMASEALAQGITSSMGL